MTPRQHVLLTFIASRLRDDGVCPSYEEMCAAIGLKAKSGIHRLLALLAQQGYIAHRKRGVRAVEILRLPDDVAGRWLTTVSDAALYAEINRRAI